MAPGASGIIDGKLFAANYAGRYTLMAQSGAAHARTRARGRAARRAAPDHGHGPGQHLQHDHTSDFWPWTGKDGRDYAIVGTWGGDG